MQPDAEHQQDDADFGKLRRKVLIRHITWRMWPHKHAGDQITDERRHPQPMGEGAEDESQHEAADDCRNQGRIVWHHCLPIWKSRS